MPDKPNHTIKELLTEMRCEVAWTDKASMSIPLYEEIKERLKQYQEIVELLPAISYIVAESRDCQCNMLDFQKDSQNVYEKLQDLMEQAGIDDVGF